MSTRHYLSADDLTVEEQRSVVARAIELKRTRWVHGASLQGRSVGLLFEKPSTRTRVSFETAVNELGGHPLVLRTDELQLGRGETLEDTGRVLSRYLAALVVRTFEQDRLEQLASAATIPVINALSDLEHPCQALADVVTSVERIGDLSEATLVYLGDGNNVCHSLLLAAAKAGFGRVVAACPPKYEPIEPIVEQARSIGEETGTEVELTSDADRAVKGANVLYTDVWTSMGQESEANERRSALQPYQLNAERLEAAAPGAVVMHCLPAHRDEEITTDVLDGPQSAVWDQAENRLHAQKAILEMLCAPVSARKAKR